VTRTEIVVVAIRILAAWFLIQGLTLLTYVALTPILAGDWRSATAALIEFVLFGLVSVLTWKFSETLAPTLLPVRDPLEPVSPLGKQDLQDVLFRTLGLFLGLTAISSLSQSFVIAVSPAGEAAGMGLPGKAELVRASVQLLAGTCLFLGKTGLGRLVEIVRHGGDPGDEEEADGDAEGRKGSAE